MTVSRSTRASKKTPLQGEDVFAYIATAGLQFIYNERGELRFFGIALDLGTQVAEVERYTFDENLRRGAKAGWVVDEQWERILWPSIYAVPMNRISNPNKLDQVYGTHWTKAGRVWGPLDKPVSDKALAEIQARTDYRRTHRDGEDPMRAVIESARARLPKPPRKAPEVYLSSLATTFRRRIGAFSDYQSAVEASHPQAQIWKVHANGHTSHKEITLLRGYFQSGWGYASGYAPGATPLSNERSAS